MDRDVAVLNRSTVATDEEVERITGALQQQVDRDFAPAWGVRTSLTFLPKGVTDGWQGRWNVVVLDTSDEANALGYHDLTPDGLPLGKCFAKTDQMVGAQLSVTMSHELLEMLGDPDVNLQAADENGRIYAYETCDAVEADDIGYDIDGVVVSDPRGTIAFANSAFESSFEIESSCGFNGVIPAFSTACSSMHAA